MPEPIDTLDKRSRWVDLDGPVHYLDFGGPADGPAMVAVHGLGGSSVNFVAIAPYLTERYRLFAPDLAGHGLTRSLGRPTDVAGNQELLHRFIDAVPGGRSRVAPEVVDQHVAVARRRALYPDGNRDFLAAARSVVSTAGYLRGSRYRRGIRSISAPVLLVHGERDRLVPVSAARVVARANPSWSLVVLPGIGHVPQLESPRETATAIQDWLEGAGRPAALAASPMRG